MRKPPKQILRAEAWESFRNRYESADDRTCAILCASYVDDCLFILTQDALLGSGKARDGLLSDMMPLSSFSARIKLAYCLNIIHDTVFADLNGIREIRNAFAHQVSDLSFAKDPIRSKCLGLVFPEDYLTEDAYHLNNDPRQYFILTCAMFSSFFARPHGHYYKRAQACRSAMEQAHGDANTDTEQAT